MHLKIPHIYRFLTIALLVYPALIFGQTRIIVYDGTTGILNTYIRNDTARITTLLQDGPAQKAGIKAMDQIISINDSTISGKGLGRRAIENLLLNCSESPVDLLIKRKGADSLMHFSFRREPYLHQIAAYEYEYLIDSLQQWDITDILSGSLDTLFRDPLTAKSTVFSVEKGSPAAKIGILPGDQVISLMEELDKDFYYDIGSRIFNKTTVDTSFTILRRGALIQFDIKPSLSTSFKGLESQFSKDFSHSCAWLKVTTENRISEDRTYLVNLPEMSGTDSASFYFVDPSGSIVEKRAGTLIPLDQRDFIYKDWHAASIPLEKGARQTFYIRWKTESSVGAPLMHFIAMETMVRHDRIERMVLFGFLGMMAIISCFFLILYFALRNRQYIYFSLYILFFATFLFVSEGYLGEFFWRASVFQSVLISSAQAFAMSLVTIFFLLFGIAYLELRSRLPGWYWSVVVVLGLIGVRILTILVGSILGFEIGGQIEIVVLFVWALSVAIIPLFILIVPVILRIREGFRPAWYFLIANLVLIPLTITTLSSTSFSLTAYTLNVSVLQRILQVSGVYIAAILQILIFSIGLAQRMRMDEKEKKIAQKKIIDQLIENEKLKDQVNRELEQKVQERTREISEQKEEIESQRDEIEAQRDLLFSQKKEITDSIGYALRIQVAILPHKTLLDKVIREYFVLFKPRDIVSGDFYWIKEVESKIVAVVADCTGHGVPGAFMSMLGITLLNELFVEGNIGKPAAILELLRTKVKSMLVQEGNIRDQKDGMDMAIAVIDQKRRELQFAGAYNPLYLIREMEQVTGNEPVSKSPVKGDGAMLFELEGDKQPIGIHWEETGFTNHTMALKENDSIYLFSDGFVDQYGGDQRKKFKTGRFKELLLSVQSDSMAKQEKVLEETFENWRGPYEQIDDVCVIGIRV
jgi:serine phosphatase RsbU (regulator of sigma subunit)